MPSINKALLKAELQWPKGTSHFGWTVTHHENDTKGSEYCDSDLDLNDHVADFDDESTLKAIDAMQTLYSIFLPLHLCSQVMPDKIVSYQIINCAWWNLMGKLTDWYFERKEAETVEPWCIYRRFTYNTIEKQKEMSNSSCQNCQNWTILCSIVFASHHLSC